MRDAFSGASKTEVGEVVVCARLIGGDLPAEQNSEAWVGLDNVVQLTPWKGVYAHYGKAMGGVVHRSARSRMKPEYRTRQREIQDLAGAVVKQHRQSDPAIKD